jgi:hypothetical protein
MGGMISSNTRVLILAAGAVTVVSLHIFAAGPTMDAADFPTLGEERAPTAHFREPSAAYACAKIGAGCERMKE